MSAVTSSAPSFVGRKPELKALLSGLDACLAGQGSVALLAGEPGIGKTRLAEELAARAEEHAAAVFWGRCSDGEGAPAFWPWIQVIRSYTRARPAEQWQEEMGAGRDDIAPWLSGTPIALTSSDDQARFRLFESVTHFLATAARAQSLVLVLDDLHWADTASLLLLQFLARELARQRLLIIGTYRDIEVGRDHPLSRALAEVSRARGTVHLSLAGLDPAEVAEFMETSGGEPPPEAVLDDVVRQTAGNPFFITQLLRAWSTGSDKARIPPTVRGAIRLRLDRLSTDCNRVLAAAALLGREFSRGTLARLNLVSPVALETALDEASNARLIGRDATGRFRFVHALVRETLQDDLPASDRLRLHQQVGRVLEGLFADDPEPHLAELAHHFAQAGPEQVEPAIHYSVLAAERAGLLLAYEDAARLYQQALLLMDLRERDDLAQRTESWLALAQAQARSGETGAARETFERAAEAARRRRSSVHLARAALGYAGSVVTPGVSDPRTVALLSEALETLGGSEPQWRVRLLGRLAMEHLYSPFRDRREALSREALELARRLNDHSTLAFALNARHFAILGPDTLEQRLAVSLEIGRLAETTGDRELALQSFPWRLADLLDLSHARAADELIESTARQADELRHPLHRWYVAVFRAMRALMQGRLAEGEELVQTAYSLGRRVQPGAAQVYYASQMFVLRWEQGRLPEVAAALRDVSRTYPGMPVFRCMQVLAALQAGQTAEAEAELDVLAQDGAARVPRDQLWLGSLALLSAAAVQLNSPHRLPLYELVLPHAQRNIMVGVTFGLGAAATYLGQLAAALGRRDEATTHFETAMALNTRLGARSWLARTQFFFADLLLDEGQHADRVRAADLLSQADATAVELGLAGIIAGIHRLRALAPAAGQAYPDGLTPREAEVLRFISAGLTNKEIAGRLVVTVPTVERHITHLYEKIGARSRAEATAYALTHGLG